jgi:hypothetical protein
VPFPAESAVAAAMRHRSDPVPDVLAERPDAPVRLAAAVERALAKDPRERFSSMDDFLAELIACRNELPAPEAAQTMIISDSSPLPGPAERLPRRRRSRARLAALLVLVLLALLAGGAYYLFGRRHKAPQLGTKPASAATVDLSAVGAYDPPPGDCHEGDQLVARATDGNPATYWQTENYTTAQLGNLKQGVGLVLDAGTALQLGSLTIQTTTPGFDAEIKAGASPSGPFPTTVSPSQTVGPRTTFTLHVPTESRYYVVWITKLAHFDTGDPSKQFSVRISEISAS